LKDLPQSPGVEQAYAFGEYHHAVMKKDYNEQQLKQFLVDKGHAALQMQPATPTIEDCFMQLMRNRYE
jgi:ABC-2 type transport system ATP-binding protein